MATQRARNRRLDQISDSPSIRRSPRLSGRISLRRDDVRIPLASVSSRPSLSGYGRGKQKEPDTSILNESGQSVPPSFEERGGSPNERRKEGVDMPHHLFGLDESDSESTTSSIPPESSHSFQRYETTRVYTPISEPYHHTKDQGFVSRTSSFFSSVLYKCGSLLYLAATGILCLDVVILHKLFNYSRSPTRSLAHYLFLPFVLVGVVLFLVGGGLISGPTVQPVGDVDMNAVLRTVTSRVQNELGIFKASFRSDIEDHVNSYINLTIQASESKTSLSVDEQLAQRDIALREYRETLTTELNSLLTQRISDLETRLRSLQDSTQGSIVTEGAMRDIASEVGQGQLNTAKTEWLTEAKQQMGVDIADSLESLRVELLDVLDSKENNLTEQLNTLSEKARSLRTDLQETQDTLTGTSNDVSLLKTQVENHDDQIAILQRKHQEILDDIAQFKTSSLARISALEATAEDTIDSNEAVRIFNEELDKILANQSSPLREWLVGNFASKDGMQDLEARVRQLEAHNEDSPVGGLSKRDVEEVINMSLERYSADKIGKFDFALENSGGSVILNKCSPTFTQSLSSVSLFGVPLWRVSGSAKLIIQPQVYPGDCWAFNGTSGHATIKLKDRVLVTDVTVEHIPKELSPNGSLSSAPRVFSVYGLTSPEDDQGNLLGTYTYDINGSSIQQFEVQASADAYEVVRFSFESNYGNPAYTCVYRVRVHGHYPE